MGQKNNKGKAGAKAPAAPKTGAVDPNATLNAPQAGATDTSSENPQEGAEVIDPTNPIEGAGTDTPPTPDAKSENPNEVKPGDPEPKDSKEGKAPKAKEQSEAEKLIAKCRKAYPKNKTFYLTSDNQVFLADARNLALLHQRSLKGGEVQTFEV